MDDVTLPPELERFAEAAVAAGRFRDMSEVVAAGVSLLQRQEQARAELLASGPGCQGGVRPAGIFDGR